MRIGWESVVGKGGKVDVNIGRKVVQRGGIKVCENNIGRSRKEGLIWIAERQHVP